MLAGYEELAGGFEPIIAEEIFLWIIKFLIIHFEFLTTWQVPWPWIYKNTPVDLKIYV